MAAEITAPLAWLKTQNQAAKTASGKRAGAADCHRGVDAGTADGGRIKHPGQSVKRTLSADDEDAAGGSRDQSRERRAFGKRIQRRQHAHINHDDYRFDVEFIQQQAQQQGTQYAADIEADLHVVDFFAAEVLVGKQRRQPKEQIHTAQSACRKS